MFLKNTIQVSVKSAKHIVNFLAEFLADLLLLLIEL